MRLPVGSPLAASRGAVSALAGLLCTWDASGGRRGQGKCGRQNRGGGSGCGKAAPEAAGIATKADARTTRESRVTVPNMKPSTDQDGAPLHPPPESLLMRQMVQGRGASRLLRNCG